MEWIQENFGVFYWFKMKFVSVQDLNEICIIVRPETRNLFCGEGNKI